jgi:hypothetical protein
LRTESVKEISDRLRALEIRMYIAVGSVATILWAVEHFKL